MKSCKWCRNETWRIHCRAGDGGWISCHLHTCWSAKAESEHRLLLCTTWTSVITQKSPDADWAFFWLTHRSAATKMEFCFVPLIITSRCPSQLNVSTSRSSSEVFGGFLCWCDNKNNPWCFRVWQRCDHRSKQSDNGFIYIYVVVLYIWVNVYYCIYCTHWPNIH